MKYIVVTGGVISGLGKGITTASIGRNLKNRGYKVTAIKIDPYLNVNAGIMTPLQHGEICVLNDGGEVDLDLGNYERFLDVDLTADHDITTGNVYSTVLDRERRGEFLGKTVQIIPHITNEIKHKLRTAAKRSGADVCLIEIGGTVGDYESMFYMEAIRQMKTEEPQGNMKFVHVTLFFDDTQGEQKTKPTQHSVKEMRTLGLSPDYIVGRSALPLKKETKEKISLFCDVPEECVISAFTAENLYEIPKNLDNQGLTDHLIQSLNLAAPENPPAADWDEMVDKMKEVAKQPDSEAVRLAMVGKYTDLPDSYISIFEAVKHGSTAAGIKASIDLIGSEKIESDKSLLESLKEYDGIIVPGAFGERGSDGIFQTVTFARENDIPFLGIGFGMQAAIIDFARNVAGLKDANTTELDEKTEYPVIDVTSKESDISGFRGIMKVGEYEVAVKDGTLARKIYGKDAISERFRNRYEINNEYVKILEEKGLVFSGDINGAKQIVELPDKKFFIGTLYHPQFKSRPQRAEPIFTALVKAAKENKK
ncbi:CTP synthase [Methanimicrococcus sp. At1]|uniref:CTP synthase (glutamine hydrolyzing) n=1 Tax=Methanimicrococcus hacksteinii TaxID=3028293 RepID=A0ABU3VMP5_9EURY|nr:CTP synthase [Methanimicrococcus sp. At1]MDV0444676.1 CTP synthase [Methanimicrococcus sp. At1]